MNQPFKTVSRAKELRITPAIFNLRNVIKLQLRVGNTTEKLYFVRSTPLKARANKIHLMLESTYSRNAQQDNGGIN